MTKIHTLYFIHHSHTDIGYTHDQPIVFDLHRRFIDEAIQYADQYAGQTGDEAFHWTVENTYVLYQWLKGASQRQIDRFLELERAGRIEVTGMFANLTPLLDTDQLLESFQILRPLREDYGLTIQYGMNCDVNGENWPLVDLLLDLGIEGFSMAINTHFGGAPMQRPNAFWWQGPSGRKILAWNGWTYDTGWRYGIGSDATKFEQTWWPRVESWLNEIEYPLPVLMVQSYHPFGDNGSAFEEYSRFIKAWNAQDKLPHLVMATPKMWWAAVKEHAHLLPAFRGDWTDYWNFGSISSAREQAMNRLSRARLRTADALAAAITSRTGGTRENGLPRSFREYREPAWHALHLFDEHTWGADCSVRAPGSEDTAAQWYHKASFAYKARSLSLLLHRDALAELSRKVKREKPDDLLVFNPLPWPRRIAGEVRQTLASPRGVAEDATAGRHFQDRFAWEDIVARAAGSAGGILDEKRLWLKPVEVPGYGYTVISQSDLLEWGPHDFREDAVVENERYRLAFDLERGGILSLYDKRLEREWVDRSAGYPFNGYVHEKVANTDFAWPRNLLFQIEWLSEQIERRYVWKTGWRAHRAQPTRVLAHRVYDTPLGKRVIQLLEAPGAVGSIKQSVFLPSGADYVECESWWDMGLETHPEATYLMYPCDVPGATARLDLGGQPIMAGKDQLPGTCRDYFTVQGWVDFSNDELGITFATPENPMVQLGGFHFGHNQAGFTLERSMLLGWVTNNYWETNFRAHQPGRVHARYRILTHQGGFDETMAHRFGLEATYSQPLLQHMGEPTGAEPVLPGSGSLLELPEHLDPGTPVMTLHMKAAEQRSGIILRVLNASDQTQQAEVGSGLLRITSAQKCDLLEKPLQAIEVKHGRLVISLPARQIATVLLEVEFSGIY